MPNLSREEQIALVQNSHLGNFVKLLEMQKTKIPSIIADNEFQTLVNAMTLEIEAGLISRVMVVIENIKEGNIQGYEN